MTSQTRLCSWHLDQDSEHNPGFGSRVSDTKSSALSIMHVVIPHIFTYCLLHFSNFAKHWGFDGK